MTDDQQHTGLAAMDEVMADLTETIKNAREKARLASRIKPRPEGLPMGCLSRHTKSQITKQGGHLVASIDTSIAAHCDKCMGRMVVETTDEYGYTSVAPCELAVRAGRGELFTRARLPSGGNQSNLSTATVEGDWAGFAQSFTPGDRGRWLYGDSRQGKTHTLVGLVRYLTLTRGIRCQWVSVPGLLQSLRKSYGDDAAESEAQVIERLSRVPVLILDEVGRRPRNKQGHEHAIMGDLIEARHNVADTSTFATSNISHHQLQERIVREYGVGEERWVYRLAELAEPTLWHTGRDPWGGKS